MTFQDKETLARRADDSLDACALRLRAARSVTGLSQKECAAEAGISPTSWNNAERGRNYPSLSTLRWLHRAYGIDYNFMLAGDFSRMAREVQDAVFAALASDTNGSDQTPD
jgi:transcriptional regulator with XRE-family HTH domain